LNRFVPVALALLVVTALSLPARDDRSHSGNGQQFVLATADTAPYSTEDGRGVYDRLLHRVFDTMGISLTIRHLPSERGLLEAAQGRIDGEFARTALVAEEFPNLRLVATPLSTWDFVAIARTGDPIPESFNELRDYHVAFINGWRIFENAVSQYRTLTLVESEEQLFAMLLAGHVDVVLYGRTRAEAWIRRHGAPPVTISENPLAQQPMYLLLHRDHESLIPQIAREIARIRDGEDMVP